MREQKVTTPGGVEITIQVEDDEKAPAKKATAKVSDKARQPQNKAK